MELTQTTCRNNVALPYTGILQARVLEWAAIPFSKGSSQPRDRTQVSCIAGSFFILSCLSHQGSPTLHYIQKLGNLLFELLSYGSSLYILDISS